MDKFVGVGIGSDRCVVNGVVVICDLVENGGRCDERILVFSSWVERYVWYWWLKSVGRCNRFWSDSVFCFSFVVCFYGYVVGWLFFVWFGVVLVVVGVSDWGFSYGIVFLKKIWFMFFFWIVIKKRID